MSSGVYTVYTPAARRPSPILGVVGPTASGKSDLALALARTIGVEILVADSRQVYRGMDVGTATPDAAARRSVPHHLVDLVDPDGVFSVAQWVAEARRLVPEITERGRLPLLVGGTGLYVASLLDGHEYAEQARSPEIRHRLSERIAIEGLERLAAELIALDPAVAAGMDLANPRRVLRALERALAGGGGVALRATPYPGRIALVGLSRPREVLHRRIEARARWMFEAGGLLDEVRRLIDAGYHPELRPMTGHGYREAARVVAGEWSIEQAIEVTARRTRQYAKRQLTWFRHEPRLIWITAGDGPADDPELVADAGRVLRAALG
jgi:tRNA dimethylallyltransferase